MPPTIDAACCASVPLPALAVLADLRREAGITVTVVGDRAWVRWEAGDEAVLRRLLPLPGAVLFAAHEGRWYRPGRHLPEFGLPVPLDGEEEAGRLPLHRWVTPAPFEVTAPEDAAPVPVRLALARDDRVRAASALRCELAALGRWADSATSAQLGAVAGARAGDTVMLLGRALPVVAGSRFWGSDVLVPLGHRAEPDLPAPALRRALRVEADSLLVLDASGVEIIPRGAFRPLTRAGVRLALGGGPT